MKYVTGMLPRPINPIIYPPTQKCRGPGCDNFLEKDKVYYTPRARCLECQKRNKNLYFKKKWELKKALEGRA